MLHVVMFLSYLYSIIGFSCILKKQSSDDTGCLIDHHKIVVRSDMLEHLLTDLFYFIVIAGFALYLYRVNKLLDE